MKILKNQKGFGVIETLLVLVIIGMIGGTAYYVYNSNKQEPQVSNSSTQNQNQSTEKTEESKEKNSSQEQEEKYLTIKEWDARIKLTSNSEDLYYELSENYSSLIFLRLKRLDQLFPGCENNSLGLQYGKANDMYVGHIGNEFTFKEAHDQLSADSPVIGKKIDGFYFISNSPPIAASCSGKPREDPKSKQETELTKILRESVSRINK